MEIATKFELGDVVYHASARPSKEDVTCPDCLGQLKWKVMTPAGAEYDYECGRCHGRGVLSMQSFAPEVRRLTIGMITACTPPGTGYHDRAVEYMCTETGIGSGSVYGEDQLYEDEETAREVAKVLAAEAVARLDERDPQRERQRVLNSYTLKQALVGELENELWDANYKLRALLDRICELDEHVSRGIGRYEDKQPRYGSLTKEQVELVQEHLVWLWDWASDHLDQYREEAEKECRC